MITESLRPMHIDVQTLRLELQALKASNDAQAIALKTGDLALSEFRAILEKQRQDHALSLASLERRYSEELSKLGTQALEQIKIVVMQSLFERIKTWLVTLIGSAMLLGMGWLAKKIGMLGSGG